MIKKIMVKEMRQVIAEQEVEIEKWQASDGKIFYDKKQCEIHEHIGDTNLIMNCMKQKQTPKDWMLDYDGIMYYPSSERDAKAIIDYCIYYYGDLIGHEKVQPNEWVLIEINDYDTLCYAFPLSRIMGKVDEINKFFNKLKGDD